MPAIFISHATVDNPVSAEIRATLTRLGFEHAFLDYDIALAEDWEKRLYEELSRCHAVLLVLTPAWFASKWCFAELVQSRALGKLILPVRCAPLERNAVLPEVQSIDLTDWNADGLRRLEERLRAISDELARGFTLEPNRPPYPGINAFQAQDAAIYFGRDEESRGTIERLDARRTQGGARFVIIIGASGSGKSSLLKASVLPLLGRRRAQWAVLPDIRPEKAPMEALAKSLAQQTGKPEAWRDWHARLTGPGAVAAIEDFVKDVRIGEARGATVLLPIDQFEEAFTTTPADERAAFLGLLQAVFAKDIPFMVIATGRSDVLEGLIESSELVGHYETFPLTAMPVERYPRLIEGPAAVAGINIEKGLSERIGRDVESKEALPLLAHMLALLYRRGSADNKLSLAEYEALGDPAQGLNPIQNSIRLAADEAIASVKPAERELAALRDAFVPHLVRMRLDDGKRVRQTARRTDLPPDALRLIGALTEARLLTTRSDGSGEQRAPLVEVTHEALFKAWPTLDQWLTEEQAFLTDLERIRGAYENWVKAPAEQKSGELLYGLLLSRARDWLLKYPQRFASREMEPLRAFIAASAQVADAEKARDAEREARAARLQRRLTVGAVVAAIVGAGLAVWAGLSSHQANLSANEAKQERDRAEAAASEAVIEKNRASESALEAFKQRERAEDQAKLAIAQRNEALITQSRFLADKANDAFEKGDRGSAVALALEALPDERLGIKRPYLASAEAILYRAVSTLREQRSFERGSEEFDQAAFMPDGQRFIMFSSRRKFARVRDATSGAGVFSLEGHTDGIEAIAFSPDGRQIVTSSRDNTARIWNAADGKPLRTFTGHADTVNAAAFSANGQRLVTASGDGSARIWDASDEQAAPVVLSMPDETIRVAQFSPDGTRIATISTPDIYTAVARIWDAESGAAIASFGEQIEGAWTDGRHIVTAGKHDVTAGKDAKGTIIEVASGNQVGEFSSLSKDSDVAFARDGARIAATWGGFRIWDAKTSEQWMTSEIAGGVGSLVFSFDGQRIAAYHDQRRSAAIWDVGPPARDIVSIVLAASTNDGGYGPSHFSPDGRRLLTVLTDAVKIWDAADEVAFRVLYRAAPSGRGPSASAPLAALSRDGRQVATAAGNAIRMWDIASGALLTTKEHPARIWAMAPMPDGTRVVTASADGKIRAWSSGAEAPVVLGEGQELAVSLAVSPDGKRVVTGANDGQVRLWQAGSNAASAASWKLPASVLRLSFSPDGQHIIAISNERAWLWKSTDAAAPVQVAQQSGMQSAAFSADGGRIVLAQADGKVRILDFASRHETLVWQAHERRVESAAFSPDGKRVVTAADDETARVWDAQSGAELAVLRGHGDHVASAAFVPGGGIITTSKDRSVRLWPAFETTQALVDHARAVMPRVLTDDQRKQVFLDAPVRAPAQ